MKFRSYELTKFLEVRTVVDSLFDIIRQKICVKFLGAAKDVQPI
jgi:hypothetical protein